MTKHKKTMIMVYDETRMKIKSLAAKNGKTMTEYLYDLVEKEKP